MTRKGTLTSIGRQWWRARPSEAADPEVERRLGKDHKKTQESMDGRDAQLLFDGGVTLGV